MSDPQEPYKIAMSEELNELGHGVKSRLAEALGVRKDAITRMTNLGDKEPRRINANEWAGFVRFVAEERRKKGWPPSEALARLNPIERILPEDAERALDRYLRLTPSQRRAIDGLMDVMDPDRSAVDP